MTASDPRLPDLQFLVSRFGRYDLITLEGWSEYDNAIRRWRVERLHAVGIEPISPEEMTERKRAKARAAKKNHAQPPGAGRAVDNVSALKTPHQRSNSGE
jgi:hypothetical protein